VVAVSDDVSMTLNGTVALVTGASSGIGEATARALAASGARVAVAARRKDRLDRLAGELDGLAIETDVTDRAQAEAAVETTVSELGRLDIVVNNAGVMLLGPIVDAPVEEWDRMISLNLQGLLYVAHAAIPHLLRAAESEPRRVADLVNVSSVAGRRVGAGGGIYQATKHAVGVFSEALRQEVTSRYVRSSLIEPGATESELVMHVREEVRGALNPLADSEKLRAEDIADAIVFIVTRPRHVAINEVLVRPTEQVR
jgi:NADP-dependent 3-hydroxy acid dehydrogenase YdfG